MRRLVCVALFSLAALYFVVRGPWRAVGSVNSYDFAAVYGAARCWLHGENPYDMQAVAAEVRSGGDDPALFPHAEPPPSVYLPTALPIVATLAPLPWKTARSAWLVLSVAAFSLSLALILRLCPVSEERKWLLAGGMLLFSPTSSGLSTGNPSVLSCGLALSAIFLALERRTLPAALLLGMAHSIKPQVSVAAAVVCMVWSYWRVVGLSLIVPAVAAVVSFLRAGSIGIYELWLGTLRIEIASAALPGGINDASAANYFSYHLVNTGAILAVWLRDPGVVSVISWILTIILAGIYVWRRRADEPLRDIAFFCCLALLPVYHRYYDAQLLLAIVPFLVNVTYRRSKAAWMVWAGLLLLLLPLQAIVAEAWHGLKPASIAGFVALRHQPLIMIVLTAILIPWGNRQHGRADVRVSIS